MTVIEGTKVGKVQVPLGFGLSDIGQNGSGAGWWFWIKQQNGEGLRAFNFNRWGLLEPYQLAPTRGEVKMPIAKSGACLELEDVTSTRSVPLSLTITLHHFHFV